MPVTTEKAVVITIELETGKMFVEGINNAQVQDMDPKEILTGYAQTGVGYDCLGWILHTHQSPGCIKLIGGKLVKVC